MSQGKANRSASHSKTAAAAAAAKQEAAAPTTNPAAATAPPPSSASKPSRPGFRLFNRYVVGLGSIVLVLLASRISIMPGHTSEDKDETIWVGESDVAAVYRDDSFGARVPVDSIVTVLQHIGLFFDRTLDPEISLVGWVFNREAGKLSKSLTEIATKMKQDWTESIVKSEMSEKAGAVLDALIATIDLESINSISKQQQQQQHQQQQLYSHNAHISPKALASELKSLIGIISETLTGSQTSEQQTPSLRTANYIDYMKIKVNKILLPDIIKEYGILLKRMGLERILLGLREVLLEWREEFKPES